MEPSSATTEGESWRTKLLLYLPAFSAWPFHHRKGLLKAFLPQETRPIFPASIIRSSRAGEAGLRRTPDNAELQRRRRPVSARRLLRRLQGLPQQATCPTADLRTRRR